MRCNLRYFFLRIVVMLSITLGASQAFCSSAWTTLAWDPPVYNADGSVLTDLEGYRVYYGKQSGIYSEFIDTENMTSTTVSLLEWDTDYVFAVKAYNHDDVESDFSEELALRTPELPSIIQQPQSTSVVAPLSAMFTVGAIGTGPLNYQWYRNGEPLATAHDVDYLLRVSALSYDGAEYDVVVSSPYGSVTSQVAVLTVTQWENWQPRGSYSWFEVDPVSWAVWPPSQTAGDNMLPRTEPNSLAVTFDATGGTYVVWTRLTDAVDDGSFYVSVDDGPEEVWYVMSSFGTESTGNRQWDAVSRTTTRVPNSSGVDAWILDLSAGTHTVRIREREPGCFIDLVLVTGDLSWTPGGALMADDGDGDGLPDSWETAYFGGTDLIDGAPNADADGDGASNIDEFVAGSSAVDGLSASIVGVYSVNGNPNIVFEALEAAGPGYDGMRRYYSLEVCTDLRTGLWLPVQGHEVVLGRDQTVQFSPASASGACYRTSMWLE